MLSPITATRDVGLVFHVSDVLDVRTATTEKGSEPGGRGEV